MLTRFRLTVAAGLVSAVSIITAAWAAGTWDNLPIVGGAAYCAANALAGIPGTSTVCVPGGTTPNVPAGPTMVSGSELIPADSGLAAGAPATVVLTLGSLNAFPYYFYTTGTAGTTYVVSPRQGGVVFDATGTITAMTVTLPPSPQDGQRFYISSDQTISSLTVNTASTPAGQVIKNNPTALTVSTTVAYGYEFLWDQNNNTWYRVR